MSNPLIEDRDRFAARYAEERAIIDGREWGVVSAGDSGPALVLLPGTLGRADIFWQQIDALKHRARILALSYPADGGVVEWAGDIATLMDRAGMATATVLGSSLGGFVAQYLAGVSADRVDGLVAANTLTSVAALGDIPPYKFDLDAEPVEKLRQGFTAGLQAAAAANPAIQPLVDLLLGEVEGRIPEAEMRSRLKALKHGPELPPVSLPRDRIVTIEAADDPLIPQPMRELVRERLKPCKAFHFKSGGHFPYVVRPRAYTAMLEERLGLEVTGDAWPDAEWSEQ